MRNPLVEELCPGELATFAGYVKKRGGAEKTGGGAAPWWAFWR